MMSDTVSFSDSSASERALRVVCAGAATVAGGFALLSLYLGTVRLSQLSGEFNLAYAVVGFELLCLLAAGFAVVYALRARPRAIGMAAACIGGTIATSCVLSFLDLRQSLPTGSAFQRWILISTAVRGLLAGLIVACGLLAVVSRHGRSWIDLVVGLVCAVPVAAVAGVIYLSGTGWMTGSGETIGYLNVIGLVVGAAVLGACLSASVHFVVSAFARSRFEGDAPPRPGEPAA